MADNDGAVYNVEDGAAVYPGSMEVHPRAVQVVRPPWGTVTLPLAPGTGSRRRKVRYPASRKLLRRLYSLRSPRQPASQGDPSPRPVPSRRGFSVPARVSFRNVAAPLAPAGRTQDDIGWRVAATITGRPVVQRLQTGSAEPRHSPRGRAACRR